MSTSLQLDLSVAPLPTGTAEDANAFAQSIIANTTAILNGDILFGQTGGAQPVNDIGPWFDGTSWWFFNGAYNGYLPQPSAQAYFNALDNAQFRVNQRRKTWNNVVDNTYTLDRWRYRSSLPTGKVSIAPNALAVPGTSFYPRLKTSLRVTSTTAQPTIGSNDVALISQPIMLSRARALFDNLSTVSLVLTSSVTGTYYAALRNADKSWGYPMACPIASPNVPQRFEFPSITAMPVGSGDWGTLDTDMAYEVVIVLCAGAGSNNGTLGSWNPGNIVAATDVTNFFSATSHTLDISVVQHQPGPSATPFIYIPFEDDIFNCQIYYDKSYEYAFASGGIDASSSLRFLGSSTGLLNGFAPFHRQMRVSPQVTIYSPSTGAANAVRDGVSNVDRAVSAIGGIGTSGFCGLAVPALGAAASGYAGYASFHYDADAEIYTF